MTDDPQDQAEQLDEDAVGQLVEPTAGVIDDEEQQIADAAGGEVFTAEEAAMHIERDGAA